MPKLHSKIVLLLLFCLAPFAWAQSEVSCQDLVGDGLLHCISQQLRALQTSNHALQQALQDAKQLLQEQQKQIAVLQQDCKPVQFDDKDGKHDGWTLVYTNDFEDPLKAMKHLSFRRRTYLRPSEDRETFNTIDDLKRYDFVLGRLHSETLDFFLCDLPQHIQIKIHFDLYLLGSWDDTTPVISADKWYLNLDNKVVHDSLFYPLDNTFYVPVDHSHHGYSGFYKALNAGELNISTSDSWAYAHDIHYKFEYTNAHTRNSLFLQMAAEFHDVGEAGLDVYNESWAIDNLKVWILETEE